MTITTQGTVADELAMAAENVTNTSAVARLRGKATAAATGTVTARDTARRTMTAGAAAGALKEAGRLTTEVLRAERS